MIIQQDLTLDQKLAILTDAAKYDVACTSSGVNRNGEAGTLGNAAACGICHAFSADGRCVSLLKILMTNCCIYDCRYCVNRVSNDTVRTTFTPEEICQLTMEFYRRNYIEGLFLSSGILNTPNETMAKIYETLTLLRKQHHFHGYIHVKAIPGADPELIRLTGLLADRMSINLELPTGEGLRTLAPAKTREKILAPMRQIQTGIAVNQLQLADRKDSRHSLPGRSAGAQVRPLSAGTMKNGSIDTALPTTALTSRIEIPEGSHFVPAGQSTQMIIGATPETDHQILSVTEALYRNFQLKRVFFSAYTAINDDSRLPSPETPPPLLREHRLYQADWLLRFYHFEADELLSESRPNFNLTVDPKADWAIRHPEAFPVEVATADYEMLLRVPGIGIKSAKRIMTARRFGTMDFSDLKRFGVALKRAQYFLLCNGRTMTKFTDDPDLLTRILSSEEKNVFSEIEGKTYMVEQPSLFDWGLR